MGAVFGMLKVLTEPLDIILNEENAYVLGGSFVGFLVEKFGSLIFWSLNDTAYYEEDHGKRLYTFEKQWRLSLQENRFDYVEVTPGRTPHSIIPRALESSIASMRHRFNQPAPDVEVHQRLLSSRESVSGIEFDMCQRSPTGFNGLVLDLHTSSPQYRSPTGQQSPRLPSKA
jgi:hypothetical protein